MSKELRTIRRRFMDLHRRQALEEVSRERGFEPRPMYEIVRQYKDIANADARETVRRAIDAEQNIIEQSALKRLLHALEDLYIELTVERLTDEEKRIEYAADLHVDGKTVHYLDAPYIYATGFPAGWRKAVADQAHRRWLRRIAPRVRAQLRSKHTRLGRLPYRDSIDFFQQHMNIPHWQLRDVAKVILRDTADPYERFVLPYLRRIFGRDLRDWGSEQLEYVYSLRHLDGAIDVEPVERLNDWLELIGLSLTKPGGLKLIDVEEREKKSARPSCIVVDAPTKVFLIMRPIGRLVDATSYLHETFHALHALYTSRHLPTELRNLARTGAVTETYAYLPENSCQEPAFVHWYFKVDNGLAHEIAQANLTVDLLKLRIYCAKYEFQFRYFEHPSNDEDNQRAYRELMQEAHPFAVTPARFLEDAWEWESVDYLMAWLLDSGLRSFVRRKFGPHWFKDPRVGGELRRLFRWGESINIFRLAYRWGRDPWDYRPLIRRYREMGEIAEFLKLRNSKQ